MSRIARGMSRLALALLALAAMRGCVAYEYEHEFWVRVDGSGSVNVTGRPELWTAFKGLPLPADEDGQKAAVRRLFEESGLSVDTVTVTHRKGRPYLFVAADFGDVNALGRSRAFPDLVIGLRPDGEHLRLEGTWVAPSVRAGPADDGLMAVRFHLPSQVYEHKNAFEGVERGNIVAWRQDMRAALAGSALDFGATIDRRSILLSTVLLFAGAIALALGILGGLLYWTARRGRARAASSGPGPGSRPPAAPSAPAAP
jgi:hypothetical protein